jgi:hypothetical protein
MSGMQNNGCNVSRILRSAKTGDSHFYLPASTLPKSPLLLQAGLLCVDWKCSDICSLQTRHTQETSPFVTCSQVPSQSQRMLTLSSGFSSVSSSEKQGQCLEILHNHFLQLTAHSYTFISFTSENLFNYHNQTSELYMKLLIPCAARYHTSSKPWLRRYVLCDIHTKFVCQQNWLG